MSPQGPALCLLDTVLDAHTLVLSRYILDEVERVLLYPRIQLRYRITPDEAIRFTGNLAEAAHLVEPVILTPLVQADPADDAILYTAADGKAEILCTRNISHFLLSCSAGVLRRTWNSSDNGLGRSSGIVYNTEQSGLKIGV